MKKITTLLLALMVVLFTQCKKDNLDNTDTNTDTETRKVKVRCEIPLGNGSRSDFSNLMTDGSIKWSTGTERIYLAVHHEENPQIVELTAETTQTATILAFEGEVDETILADGAKYNVWYFGNSQNLGEDSYVTKNKENGLITSVSGSIANQSGSLEDLGYHHIAKAEVTAKEETDGSFTLPLHGTLQNQIAIAYMDLTDVTKLSGEAIIGTDYSLEYSNGEYKFVINENNNEINITPNQSSSSSASFVVLLPNENTNVDITADFKKYTFKDGIAASSLYYRYISDVEVGTLKWEWMEGYGENNGRIYVDLGLSVNWATVNIGATNPEEAGDFFAWGETEPKDTYNWSTYNLCNGTRETLIKYCINSSYGYNGFTDNITVLEITDDAAAQNWGDGWMMPTQEQLAELRNENNCTWTWTTVNGVTGYQITSKVPGYEGNSIFLPYALYKDDGGSTISTSCLYWTSTLYTQYDASCFALCLEFRSNYINLSVGHGRFRGCLIRPVREK